MTVSILLAEELMLVREGLAALCHSRPGFIVVAQCASGSEALEQARRLGPAVAIVDSAIPGLPASEVIRVLRQEESRVRVVVLLSQSNKRSVLEALQMGANAVVLKSGPSREFLDSLEAVLDGRVYLSPSLELDTLYMGESSPGPDPLGSLSPRESQVFTLLVEGIRAKEIAARLNLSPKTVDTYRSSLMRKLDIHDVAGLVKFAIQRRLIPM